MLIKELWKLFRIVLSGSEKMISIGVTGWSVFGCCTALSLLIGNEFIITFSIVMFITSSAAALIGCLLHITELAIIKMEKEKGLLNREE